MSQEAETHFLEDWWQFFTDNWIYIAPMIVAFVAPVMATGTHIVYDMLKRRKIV